MRGFKDPNLVLNNSAAYGNPSGGIGGYGPCAELITPKTSRLMPVTLGGYLLASPITLPFIPGLRRFGSLEELSRRRAHSLGVQESA